MDYVYSIVMGIVQGLTEFLPVSSSGHLTLVQHIFGVDGEGNFFFNVMLHVGTLVAVCVFYYKLLWDLIKSFFLLAGKILTGKFKWKDRTEEENMIFMLIVSLVPLFLLFLPVPGMDCNFKDLSEMFSENKYLIVVSSLLLVTSVLLTTGIICNKRNCRKSKTGGRYTYNIIDAIVVGITQDIATLPGISRSGSTLAAAEMRGINKQKAIDYTFILGTPTILASAVFELKDAFDTPVASSYSLGVLPLVVGMIVSAVVGYLAIWIFKWFLKTDKMYIFAIYTAVVGIVGIIIAIIEMQTGTNIFSGAKL
ncbi:MAG: undecaprenyl-diphosphate phosphatase [Ruminococcus sp.]|nr:undecaprenyl-diphosphate phosphatase [Ruminococcus sp.]